MNNLSFKYKSVDTKNYLNEMVEVFFSLIKDFEFELSPKEIIKLNLKGSVVH